MIVVDASALIEVLLRAPAGAAIERRLFSPGETLHAPHLIDLEVAHVLRRHVANRSIAAKRGREALEDCLSLALTRYGHGPLLPAIWEMRDNFSACDAAYVALARELGAALVTRDARLAKAAGRVARVELV